MKVRPTSVHQWKPKIKPSQTAVGQKGKPWGPQVDGSIFPFTHGFFSIFDPKANQNQSLKHQCARPHHQDYPSELEWGARLMLEKSKAVKCPSVDYQLVGAKKASGGGRLRWFGLGWLGCLVFGGKWGEALGEALVDFNREGLFWPVEPWNSLEVCSHPWWSCFLVRCNKHWQDQVL